jgi:phosphatidylinositol-3-phosphatase
LEHVVAVGRPADPGLEGGPNWAYPGFSPLLALAGFLLPTTPGADPGGGRVGAVLLNAKYIEPGSVDTTGSYNGHLGFAAAGGVAPFGPDVFNRPPG